MSSVASLRQIRRRIRSVENTQKITRAMEMVAAAKLRRFQDFLESARPYTKKLEDLLLQLLLEIPVDYTHPFLEKSETKNTKRTVLVLFTSDTGLCGTYNSELEGTAHDWIRRNPEREISIVFIGKHGAGSFHKKEKKILGNFFDLRVSRVDEILEESGKILKSVMLDDRADEVIVIYTRMESLARFQPVVEKILSISKKPSANAASTTQTIIEPDAKAVLDRLLPAIFEARLRYIFYHALLTEQIARMNAMRQATKNAKDMIEELTLLRNKARQASITKEIIEIVSGSRALKLK